MKEKGKAWIEGVSRTDQAGDTHTHQLQVLMGMKPQDTKPSALYPRDTPEHEEEASVPHLPSPARHLPPRQMVWEATQAYK